MPTIQPGAPQQENTVQKLIEGANTKAFQRGAKKPGWTDVWEALCDISEFQRVMQERGVRTSGLAADLNFISKIGTRPASEGQSAVFDTTKPQFDISPAIHSARDELLVHLRELQADMRTNVTAEDAGKVGEILQRVIMKISAEIKPEDSEEKFMLKARLLERAVTQALTDPNGAIGLVGPEGPEKGMKKLQISQIARQVAQILYRENVTSYQEAADDIIPVLEGLKVEGLFEPASPAKVFDTIREASGDSYGKLLLRNGYFSTDDSVQTDELAPLFPNDFMRNLALQAVGIAYRTQSREVNKSHVIAALLENRNVMVNLTKLGMKDQMKFLEKYHEKAFGKPGEDEGRKIRVHPKVTDEFKTLIWEFSDKVKEWDDEVRGPEMFCQIFREDKEADKMLNESGLLRRMQRSWRSAYDEDWKLKREEKDEKKDKKKAEEFKVPDEALNQLIEEYCTDYTALAKKKKFDPLIGQEKVMETVLTTLLKRGKKNPIMIGDAGIGKSKILEGLGQRIVTGKVPTKLVGARLLTLDMQKMSSPWAGVFDNTLKAILQGVSERNASGRFPPILFGVDEFAAQQHAGAHSKGDGAKDIIKPYLTSGDLFVIANTTTKEFQNDVQKDGALARRFNPVAMVAPTLEETVEILKQLKQKYARHHGIRIPDDQIRQVAEIAERYISTNQPDKSIDMLDYACAIAVRSNARTLGEDHAIEAGSAMSNISKEFLSKNDKERYRKLPGNLKKEILQQDKAVDAVTAPLQRSRFGLREPGKPLGNFLFVGPSGVGKTELTRGLARHLYGSDDKNFLLRYDMAEFMEKHSVSKFIGSPPGYVGMEEGGRLINDVNAHPFSVILYDEIEKAHEDIYQALLAPFSNGVLTAGNGQSANFKNTINVMTSNLGNKAVLAMGKKLGLDPLKDHAAWQTMARSIYEAAVKAHFTTEFLGRLDGIIYFDGLTGETIELLTDRRIEVTRKQLRENNGGLDVELGPNFRKAVVGQGYDYAYGARPLNNAVKNMVETPLARHLLDVPDRKLARLKSVFMEVADDWVVPHPDVIAAGAVEPGFTDVLKEKPVKVTPPVSAPPAPVAQPAG